MSVNVTVCKVFNFDSAHQLVNHKGKCANLHGHTYTLEVILLGPTKGPENKSDEGFVIDFADVKQIVNEQIVDDFDHAFIAQGNEPALKTLQETDSKVFHLGFRTTVENMCIYICWKLMKAGLPVHSIKLWETAKSWAMVKAKDLLDNESGFLENSM